MIREIRILPPLTIARLGSSERPMENYNAVVDENDPLGFRRLTPAPTLVVNRATGAITRAETPANVRFKVSTGRVKPVAPFLEVWCERGDGILRPLTSAILTEEGLTPADVRWRVRAGNVKAFRRTGDENDRILADTGVFSAHAPQVLAGRCEHFVRNKTISFGDVQYIRPSNEFPEIRLRFTPGKGHVYGATKAPRDPRVQDIVYDSNRGRWSRHVDGEMSTSPGEIFAGERINGRWVSRGYLDDACDGIVEVEITAGANTLRSFARFAAGPPDYAPDSFPVRTIADELEQALLGPVIDPGDAAPEVAEEILRRAFETVRLQNTAALNGNELAPDVRASSMAGHDTFYDRLYEPIMAPALVDNLAIRTLHQSVFGALTADTAAWFGQVLRDYDEVGDLTARGRRKMPAMMRGSDGLHLALTRRQVDTIRKASSRPRGAAGQVRLDQPQPVDATTPAVVPLNQTARMSGTQLQRRGLEETFTPNEIPIGALLEQLSYRARGNPAGTLLTTAISNCFPGLEFDFRNAWKRIFVEIEMQENTNIVIGGTIRDVIGRTLVRVERPNGEVLQLMTRVIGPGVDARAEEALERSNAFASLLNAAGETVRGVFRGDSGRTVTREITVRNVFAPGTAAISQEMADPGDLGQSLCSPWQNDYRECGCYYWAASRPDYINVEAGPQGTSIGHNWIQKRPAGTAKNYMPEDNSRAFISYDELFQRWEEELRFQVGGEDSE